MSLGSKIWDDPMVCGGTWVVFKNHDGQVHALAGINFRNLFCGRICLTKRIIQKSHVELVSGRRVMMDRKKGHNLFDHGDGGGRA